MPETNGVAVLTEEVERFREIYNQVRPHEALDFLTPMVLHHAGPKISEAERVQET